MFLLPSFLPTFLPPFISSFLPFSRMNNSRTADWIFMKSATLTFYYNSLHYFSVEIARTNLATMYAEHVKSPSNKLKLSDNKVHKLL